MRRLAVTLLLALAASVALAQTSWGVRVQLDVPVSDAVAFAIDPIAYAALRHDVIDVRAFLEHERIGLEGRYRSSGESSLNLYYVLSAQDVLVLGYLQSNVGLVLGRDARSGAVFVAVRGVLVLAGSF